MEYIYIALLAVAGIGITAIALANHDVKNKITRLCRLRRYMFITGRYKQQSALDDAINVIRNDIIINPNMARVTIGTLKAMDGTLLQPKQLKAVKWAIRELEYYLESVVK